MNYVRGFCLLLLTFYHIISNSKGCVACAAKYLTNLVQTKIYVYVTTSILHNVVMGKVVQVTEHLKLLIS